MSHTIKPTLSKILESLPPQPYWRSDRSGGKPLSLTLDGKVALTIMETHHLSLPKILELLGLKMRPEEFAEFRQRSSLNLHSDLNERHKQREQALRDGTWRPDMIQPINRS